jgi:hypothetical protein
LIGVPGFVIWFRIDLENMLCECDVDLSVDHIKTPPTDVIDQGMSNAEKKMESLQK